MSIAGMTWNGTGFSFYAASAQRRPKLPRSRRAADWLFSGGNWTGSQVPRATAALTGKHADHLLPTDPPTPEEDKPHPPADAEDRPVRGEILPQERQQSLSD